MHTVAMGRVTIVERQPESGANSASKTKAPVDRRLVQEFVARIGAGVSGVVRGPWLRVRRPHPGPLHSLVQSHVLTTCFLAVVYASCDASIHPSGQGLAYEGRSS